MEKCEDNTVNEYESAFDCHSVCYDLESKDATL